MGAVTSSTMVHTAFFQLMQGRVAQIIPVRTIHLLERGPYGVRKLSSVTPQGESYFDSIGGSYRSVLLPRGASAAFGAAASGAAAFGAVCLETASSLTSPEHKGVCGSFSTNFQG